jgi:hypothetical protein
MKQTVAYPMERKPRRAWTEGRKEDWAKVVTEMDMNSQKVKETNPPSFRPAEVSGPGRFVGSNRAFECPILKLWRGFTPLAQPTAWRERDRREKRKINSRARMIKMGDGDLRSRCADRHHARC